MNERERDESERDGEKEKKSEPNNKITPTYHVHNKLSLLLVGWVELEDGTTATTLKQLNRLKNERNLFINSLIPRALFAI